MNFPCHREISLAIELKVFLRRLRLPLRILSIALVGLLVSCATSEPDHANILAKVDEMTVPGREQQALDTGWRFYKYASREQADDLIYDQRPEVTDGEDGKPADAMPTAAEQVVARQVVLKPWVLPTANPFIRNPANRFPKPAGDAPGTGFPYTLPHYNDSEWQEVTLPHDWAIHEQFYSGDNAPVGGGMGRLPSPGVAWYRKKLDIAYTDRDKAIFLNVDGAMSYATVWLNGHLVGGWPYGYASWRVNLTPYINFGGENQLAIRVDNPPHSSRWYPGGGLYRDVSLVKTPLVHIGQWGTQITTPEISDERARVDIEVAVDNRSDTEVATQVVTRVFAVDVQDKRLGAAEAEWVSAKTVIPSGGSTTLSTSGWVQDPRLWGPPPTQSPHRYLAETTLLRDGAPVDRYETPFGIRTLTFDAQRGLKVNGETIYLKGVNQHHDLGALGAAFNVRAAQRQLEVLRELGANAIRMAHNPPDPKLLELTDKMGFLVVDEIFDVWARKKTPLDFHLIFPDWHEADLRAFIRRDRNHPSVIMWSIGNEVGEQYTGAEGTALAQKLHDITKQEDPTRPTGASMNYAKPDMAMPAVFDTIHLNYQGEGIRDAPAYKGLKGITTKPLYPAFHQAFPQKMIVSSENAAAVSSRGEYLFPVTDYISAPVKDGHGGDPDSAQVSAYELYTAPFGSSADKVFRSLDQHPYVAGGFVWSGWDYLGEPTPYYSARSSYFGVIDLAGFPKDRFYLYQSQWRPDYPMAHILPHWNWPDRLGKTTPVHVFTSGDEAELFLNGRSLGRRRLLANKYRLRWEHVRYEPGELKVVAYKHGEVWATDTVVTSGEPARIRLSADREVIETDGKDLSFVSVTIVDDEGHLVPNADTPLYFQVEGAGELVATDNGDPTSLIAFSAQQRPAFNGKALAIIKAKRGADGPIWLRVSGKGLPRSDMKIEVRSRIKID